MIQKQEVARLTEHEAALKRRAEELSKDRMKEGEKVREGE